MPPRGERFDGVCAIEYEPLEDTGDGLTRSLAHLRRAVACATLGA
jgi:hypothetical protein